MKLLSRIRRQVYATFYSFDTLASALTGGDTGETISARLAAAKGLGHWACRALDGFVLTVFGEHDHCRNALLAYEARETAAPFGG